MSHFSFPNSKGSENVPASTKSMIEKGQDPKEMLIEVCKVLFKQLAFLFALGGQAEAMRVTVAQGAGGRPRKELHVPTQGLGHLCGVMCK
jgi:hypothetical protein